MNHCICHFNALVIANVACWVHSPGIRLNVNCSCSYHLPLSVNTFFISSVFMFWCNKLYLYGQDWWDGLLDDVMYAQHWEIFLTHFYRCHDKVQIHKLKNFPASQSSMEIAWSLRCLWSLNQKKRSTVEDYNSLFHFLAKQAVLGTRLSHAVSLL